MLASQMIRYRIKKEVKMQRQKRKEKEVKYFRYQGVKHYKQKYPNIVAEKERKRKKEVAYVARSQKVQQERSPVCPTQEKTQEYCEKGSMPPENTLLLKRGWLTEEVVAMYVNCRGCKDKEVQTHKNQKQEFLLKRQVKNIWYNLCQKAWN